ncbi:hypothetical protein [Aeromicrobium ginsengisoli]|uniref:LPXTG cell wall anchor domain-containing protein n=1 Tax=Aeromicrobium ginsengisoli TaxID=363867 RepID=A0A5M4FK13_9ACTN|nr:hypothetical protein [Aeromicrobium ginsengisoli]KAA1400103.1 hypothetical protein ESP70_005010 [Aeromicrobium ginsengisoli]
MKKILIVLAMIAASVFLAQPAVADEGDAPAEAAVETTADTTTESAPDTAEPEQQAPAETTPPAAESKPEPVVNDEPAPPARDANKPAPKPDDTTSGNAPNDDVDSAAAVAAAVDLDAKVTICHVPPGNPANAHAISVSYNSIVKGEGHGKNNAAHASDWIPSFEYLDGDTIVVYPGRNTNEANPCDDEEPLIEVGTEDPTLAGPTCLADGKVNLPTTDGVTYTVTPANAPGEVDVDATANAGYIIDDQATIHWDFTVLPKLSADNPQCVITDGKKVVVCKYVGAPPGTPDHIIVVNESALGDGFQGVFPYAFGDAQDSIAIRYAVGNEQPGDEELVNCPTFPTEITAEAPIADPATCDEDGSLVLPETDHVTYTTEPVFDGPGDYTITASVTDEEFVLTGQTVFEVTVGGKLPTADCVTPDDDTEPAKEDDLLPDTGGLPLWILLLAGPMTAAGLIILMRREPVSHASSSGRMPSYSLILPPVKKPARITRAHATTEHIGFMKAVSQVVAAIGSFFRGGRR